MNHFCTLHSPEDTDAILKYIAKNLSWRKLYFSKFTIGQKILFFVPPFFIPFPIYGMRLFLDAHLWVAAVVCVILMVISGWAVGKQKMVFEKKVFEKHYQSGTCKSMLDFELEKFVLFLGEQNTFENRLFWMDYFKKNQPSKLPIAVGVGTVVASSLHGMHRNSSLEFYGGGVFQSVFCL
ncbi:hypothetical protein AGMMS49982_10660 [Bacteroidia bacterium]|nr:hypothetical protein AGMMS49982_10660 [Bacteroidia bacterium]